MKKKKQTTDFNDYELFERVKQDLRQQHQKIIEDKTTYNNNEFADWLFNEFVRAERRDKQDWSLNYLCALKQYALVGLSHPQQYEQRLYAFKLEIIATEAMAGWNTHLLILRGEESEKDFESEMTAYKERLHAIGHDEATIKKMLEYRIKLNYGTD